MLTRAWILETLALLPLYYWPVFFLEVWRFERYYRAYRAANPVGMLGVAVLPNGRLVITLQVAGDRPDPDDWTNFAPRAPWVRLAPGGRRGARWRRWQRGQQRCGHPAVSSAAGRARKDAGACDVRAGHSGSLFGCATARARFPMEIFWSIGVCPSE